ncbi:MAG: DUF58 domain-containing protein [Pseudomonadota bacterium]
MSVIRSVWSRLAFGKFFQNKAQSWAKKRQGIDGLEFTLHAKRLYILPTAVGLILALAVFVMLLGAMNYSNSLAFVLTFSLAAIGLVSMHHCHRNLGDLSIRFRGAESVFAGEDAAFNFSIMNPSAQSRYDIVAQCKQGSSDSLDIAGNDQSALQIRVSTNRRGPIALGRISLSTRFPFALFRAWAWVYNDYQCLVWPQPAAKAPAVPISTHTQGTHRRSDQGDDDFSGLREYQAGDPRRQIAWKAAARSDTLVSKQFSGSERGSVELSIEATGCSDLERALQVLSRWILDCENDGIAYGLSLKGTQMAPALGRKHRNRCLDQLALFASEPQ